MEPIVTPFLHGGPLGHASFKSCPEDFVVEEVLGFHPSGEGEHCLLWIEKRDLDSNAVGARIADTLGIRRRLVSHCGLKDRHAITRQWFSVHLPGQESPEPTSLEREDMRVLKVTRNGRKLRRGTHVGNRFIIRLREPSFGLDEAQERWSAIASRGVANSFGPQRFGHEGRNMKKVLAMFRGEFVTHDRLLRGLLLSAARSHLFNAVVAERMHQGNWEVPLEGEVFGFSRNRSLILPERYRGDESGRVAEGLLELTAPLYGEGELQSAGEVRAFELSTLASYSEITSGLEAYGLRQERRVIRVRPEDAELESVGRGDLQLRFALTKGTYATSVLRELAELREPA